MAHFKTKRRKNKLIIYIIIFLLSIFLSIKYLFSNNNINNNSIIDSILTNVGVVNNDNNNVDFLLKYAFNINKNNSKKVVSNENNEQKLELSVNKENISPIVYIYNTHQSEKYKSSSLENYNINSSVLIGSKILKEYLLDYGIGAYVEENNVEERLKKLKLDYGSSYKISREFMENAKKDNPTLKYFVDFHRDASMYNITTTEIDGEKYARVLFVIGMENANYQMNLDFANKLKEKIDKYDKNLCRGIITKSGRGVNGVYNQDFSNRVILIEVGGEYNHIDEVNNTLKVFAKVLVEYIKEEENE